MTDYHVITIESAELVMQVIDSQLVIVPPAAAPAQPATERKTEHGTCAIAYSNPRELESLFRAAVRI